MVSPLRKLAGETALYGLSSIVGRSVNFLLVPFYTSVLAPGAYGVVTELYAYVAFLNVLYTYGMETAYFCFATRQPEHAPRTYAEILTLILLTSVLLSGVLWVLAEPIATALRYPGRGEFVRYLALTLGIDAVAAMAFARLRLEKKAKKFAFVRLANILVNVGLNLFFLLFCRYVYEGRWLPALRPLIGHIYDPELGVGYVFLSNLMANALFVWWLRRELFGFRLRWPAERLGPMWRYAYPLLFMGLAGTVNEMLGRSFLKYLLPDDFYADYDSQTALGIYGACYKLSVFITLGVQAFRYAAEPFFFSNAADKNSPALFARVMHWFVIVTGLVFLAISLHLDWLAALLLRNPIYRDGLLVVPVLLMANIFLGMYYNFSVWFKLTDRTGYGTLLSGGGAVLTVVGNLALIPVLGYLGSALTALICYAAMAAACYGIGQRHYPVPYRVGRYAAYLLLATGLWLGAEALAPTTWGAQVLVRLTALLGYGAVVAVAERWSARG